MSEQSTSTEYSSAQSVDNMDYSELLYGIIGVQPEKYRMFPELMIRPCFMFSFLVAINNSEQVVFAAVQRASFKHNINGALLWRVDQWGIGISGGIRCRLLS